MTALEQQMIDELVVAQVLTNDLATNLTAKGVPSNTSEGLDTLVPKVLQIESGGGTTKSPYELWQEGFGANWDSVILNSPQTGVNPALHIYSKVNAIRLASNNPNPVTIVTYNPTTGIYRPVTVDANRNLFFEESDYFINNNDGMYYCCVIYKASSYWYSSVFGTTLPIVYSNTKFCTGEYTDIFIFLIRDSQYYPFLRGVDCYNQPSIKFNYSLEHLTVAFRQPTINIIGIIGSDTQVRLLKEFVEKAPAGTIFTPTQQILIGPSITDAKLADWFFNDFFYKNFNGTAYGAGVIVSTKNVKRFKVNPNILLTGSLQLNCIPNCSYLEGTFTENQSNNAASAGIHNGFRTESYTLLQNFPMWTVLEGATTGCLLPMKNQTNVGIYLNGSFRFYSKNLERKYFCEFDENGIIEDPTKYFICNLPIETETHANIQVKIEDLTFKNQFTAEEQTAIQGYLNAKKWNLLW